MSKEKAPSSVSGTQETKIITPKLGLVGVKKEKVPIEKKNILNFLNQQVGDY